MKAATAIGNEGKMMKPYVISSVVDSDTEEILYKSEPEVAGEPISAETSERLKELFGSVMTDGTGRNFQLNSYSSLGKTGTAQLPDPETGGWLSGPGDYVFSFMGMAPKDDPELLMFIAVKQPEIENYSHGSRTTSYIFKTVMENSLNYLNVEPDQEDAEPMEPIELGQLAGSTVEEVKGNYGEKGLTITTLGSGDEVIDSRPFGGDEIFQSNRLLLLTDGEVKMPDLTGWPLRDVLHISELLDLQLDFVGSGFVDEQSIKPGAVVQENDRLVIELKSNLQQYEDQLEVVPEGESEGEPEEDSNQDAEGDASP